MKRTLIDLTGGEGGEEEASSESTVEPQPKRAKRTIVDALMAPAPTLASLANRFLLPRTPPTPLITARDSRIRFIDRDPVTGDDLHQVRRDPGCKPTLAIPCAPLQPMLISTSSTG